MILFLLIILGLVLYVMTPEERVRLVRTVADVIRRVRDVATVRRPEPAPFRDALRARTSLTLVTPILVALNVTIFVFMLFGDGSLSDPETLVGWGGNFGPRTTNGEWWRLVTTTFVHAGILHLLANVAGLLPLGLVLERLVGRFAFATVYLAAGVFASLVSLSAYPVAISVGASGAIFGIYGLLVAASFWGVVYRSNVTIPLVVFWRLGPPTAMFMLYNVVIGSLERDANIAALAVGFVGGLFLTRDVSQRTPPARRVATAMAATAVIALVSAVPMRGIANVMPEIERIVAFEDRTASVYETAVDRFKKGRVTAEALVQVIDRTIMPELRAARARLKALDRVPQEHQQLVASAEEYLRLRDESWRLRAEALHKASMPKLREADRTERASLEALERIRTADQN